MQRTEDSTYNVPRFLSFIDLAYLLEAAKAADEHLAAKLPIESNDESRHVIGNLNATRQSLIRAVFIASYSIIEQNLDELVLMERTQRNIEISPSDLKDKGISRSLTYANKVLGKKIQVNSPHWQDLMFLQSLRNHLVHYGPNFSNTKEHDEKFFKFSKSKYVTLRPIICFTILQVEHIFDLYMKCINDFSTQ